VNKLNILEIIKEVLNNDSIDNNTSLLEEELLDSVALVKIISKIEENENVEIDLAEIDIDDFESAETISEMVLKLKS